jgi:hypothetical protein
MHLFSIFCCSMPHNFPKPKQSDTVDVPTQVKSRHDRHRGTEVTPHVSSVRLRMHKFSDMYRLYRYIRSRVHSKNSVKLVQIAVHFLRLCGSSWPSLARLKKKISVLRPLSACAVGKKLRHYLDTMTHSFCECRLVVCIAY